MADTVDSNQNESVPEQPARSRNEVILIFAALCCFYPSFAGVFVLDDYHWITHSPTISRLPEWKEFFGGRSVGLMSLKLNYWLDGLNTRGYHFFNLVIHLISGLALFGVLRRTLQMDRVGFREEQATKVAFCISLLWIVHPLTTQAVTYVVQRFESLMGMFFLLTFYTLIRAITGERKLFWYSLSLLCFLAGLYSKEVMVMALPVFLVYDWIFASTSLRELIRKRWAYYSLMVIAIGVFLWTTVLGLFLSEEQVTIGFRMKSISATEYLRTQATAIAHYLQISIWPTNLAFDYMDWPTAREFSDWGPPGLVIVAILCLIGYGIYKRRPISFLGAWFFFILAPTSSIVPIQDRVVEHRMYLPLISVVALAVFAVHRVVNTYNRSRVQLAVIGLFLIATSSLAYLTLERNLDYSSGERLFRDNVRVRPNNHRAWVSMAEHQFRTGQMEKAKESILRSFEITKSSFSTHYILGMISQRQGKLRQSVHSFEFALRLHPEGDFLRYPLAQSLLLLEEPERAIAVLEQLTPNQLHNARRLVVLAVAYQNINSRVSQRYLAQSLELDSDWPRRYARQAEKIVMQDSLSDGELRLVRFLIQSAKLAHRGGDANDWDLLGIVESRKGQFDRASEYAEIALWLTEPTDRYVYFLREKRKEMYETSVPYMHEFWSELQTKVVKNTSERHR